MRLLFKFYLFIIVFIGCSNYQPDLTSPEKTVESVMTATFQKDAVAFMACFSPAYLNFLDDPQNFTLEKIEHNFKRLRSKTPFSKYQITGIEYQGARARVEFVLNDPKAITTSQKSALLLEKTNNEWKVYGYDELPKYKNEWEKTELENKFRARKQDAV